MNMQPEEFPLIGDLARPLDRRPTSIHRKLGTLDEAGAICREKDNGFGNLVGCRGTPGWRLGS